MHEGEALPEAEWELREQGPRDQDTAGWLVNKGGFRGLLGREEQKRPSSGGRSRKEERCQLLIRGILARVQEESKDVREGGADVQGDTNALVVQPQALAKEAANTLAQTAMRHV